MNYLGITESDGLALAMLGTIALSFCVIGLLIGCMLWASSRRDLGVDTLLDEIEETERQEEKKIAEEPKSGESQKGRDGWERDENWWKDGGVDS